MPAACSVTRMMERLLLAPCCFCYGQRTSDWGRTANPEYTVLTSAEVTDLIAGVEIITNDQGNRTTLSLPPSRLLTPKSEPGLKVDLSNCVIDVSSRCDLSLAARDTVEPAVEKSRKNIVLNLICMIRMFA